MRRMLFLVPLVLALAACGGSGGSTTGGNAAAGPAGDPVGAVNNVINAMKAKAFDKMGPLVCAAKRDAITGASGERPAGWPADAMAFDFQDLKVNQTSINGDTAGGARHRQAVVTLDAAKGKDAVRKMLRAGAPSGTRRSRRRRSTRWSGLRQRQHGPSRATCDVVKENGGWVVCSRLSTS